MGPWPQVEVLREGHLWDRKKGRDVGGAVGRITTICVVANSCANLPCAAEIPDGIPPGYDP